MWVKSVKHSVAECIQKFRKIRAPIKIKSALPPQKSPPQKGEFYGHGFSCRKNAFFQVSIKLAHPFPAPELRTRILRTRGFFWKIVFFTSPLGGPSCADETHAQKCWVTILAWKRNLELTWAFTVYILHFIFYISLMCVILRFSCQLFSDKFIFQDCFFHVSLFRTDWVQVGPAWFGFLLGLCFGSGLLRVQWSLKSTTSHNFVATTPNLFWSTISVVLFWWLFWGGCFWVVLALKKGLVRSFYGRHLVVRRAS